MMIAIGLVGMRQIDSLSRVVDHLAGREIPLQNAVLDMKAANARYASGIRNYMFWRGARYLEAASLGGKQDLVKEAAALFDRNLAFYSSLMRQTQQQKWVETIRSSEEGLRRLGENIIKMVDRTEEASVEDRKTLEGTIISHLMEFENRLYQIEAYLNDPLQEFNVVQIRHQLEIAEEGRRRSVWLLSLSLVVGILLGGQTAYVVYRRSRREQEHRELLWRKVIRAEEEERNNLSLQIHDQMGQDLSGMRIYLGLVEKELPEGAQESREKIEKTKKILSDLMDKTHNISELLRPPELDDLGFEESIAALILQYREMTGNEYRFQRPQENCRISSEHSLVLYRVAQEALTNIAKYSQAKNIDVSIGMKDDQVVLSVADDGVGFDYEEYLRAPQRRKEDRMKLGLQGLRERIELLGGTLRVFSKPGKGTRLEVELPVT